METRCESGARKGSHFFGNWVRKTSLFLKTDELCVDWPMKSYVSLELITIVDQISVDGNMLLTS